MKRICLLLTFCFCCAAHAQYVRSTPDFSLQNAQGQAIAGAQVYVLTQPANTSAFSPLATLYGSSSGSGSAVCGNTGGVLTQPLTTDGFGHACAYAAPGVYTVCYVSPYIGTQCYQDQNWTTLNSNLFVALAGTTMSGALASPSLNGAFNPASCGGSAPPSWCSGSDMGAWINAAIAQTAAGPLSSGYGIVRVPPGNYSFSTPISLAGYQNIILDCQGANLTWNGSASVVINALQTVGGGSNSSGEVENCNVFAPATAPANTTVFLMGNVLNYKLHHNSAWNFDASGDVAFEVENTVYFTEDSLIDDNQARQDTVGYEFLKNCTGGNCTNSMEYTFFRNNYYNSPYVSVSRAIGLNLVGGVALQNSVVELHGNINGPSGGTLINLATGSDQILRDQIAIQAEFDSLGSGTGICVTNNGGFYANGTFQCDAASSANTGNPVVVFGSDGQSLGGESLNTSATNVVVGATSGTNSNLLPDSEDRLGSSYWQSTSGDFSIGNSPANTGHTDYGYWNTGSALTCITGSVNSQTFTLPAGTYTISAEQAISGANTTGCSSSFANVAIYAGSTNIANLYNSKNWNAPVTFTLVSPTSIYWNFTYQNYNFPTNSYLIWYAPQIEQGSVMTAYKQSTVGGGSSKIPVVGTPTAGQASCIKSVGPPVVIGYCSTVVSSGGACTCN